MQVKVIHQLDELEPYQANWESLVEAALEPNPFYEPWMLIPALRAFGATDAVEIVLMLSTDAEATPQLYGLFPIQRKKPYLHLPASKINMWQYKDCYLCTPLVRATSARETLAAFFDWVAQTRSVASCLEFNQILADGDFQRCLSLLLNQKKQRRYVLENKTRALFQPAASNDEYLSGVLSVKGLRNIRRLAKRLSEEGEVEYRVLNAAADVEPWTNHFLAIEASGWKGQESSALICSALHRQFFAEIVRGAFQRGKLLMFALYLERQPIAMLCTFLTGNGGFIFKTAYDETYAKCGPGVLLLVHNLRALHERPNLSWIDSCAAPDNRLFNRLSNQQRTIHSSLVAVDRGSSNLLVAFISALKWVSKTCELDRLKKMWRHQPRQQPEEAHLREVESEAAPDVLLAHKPLFSQFWKGHL